VELMLYSIVYTNESPATNMEGQSSRVRLTRKFVVTHRPKFPATTSPDSFWYCFVPEDSYLATSFVNHELS
jgi:hypothetical protein